jgi:hypothetical protein
MLQRSTERVQAISPVKNRKMATLVPLLKWGRVVDLDQTFVGLRDAAVMGLRTPPSLYVRDWTSDVAECHRLSEQIVEYFESEHRLRNYPGGLCIRFGDKFRSPGLPMSVCHIGSSHPLLQDEHSQQLSKFASLIGARLSPSSSREPWSRLPEMLSEAALTYRRIAADTPQALVQLAVDSITHPSSAYGVAYTRDPKTGEDVDFGRYMRNVSGFAFNFLHVGSPDKKRLTDFSRDFVQAHKELGASMKLIETYYDGPRFLEFAVDAGILWILQITQRREQKSLLSIRRSVSEDWHGAALPLEDWITPGPPLSERTFVWRDASVRISADTDAMAEFALFCCRRAVARGYTILDDWHLILKQDRIPEMDYAAGSPVVLFRTKRSALMGRRYRAPEFEIIFIPLRRSVITLRPFARKIAVVGQMSPIVLRYAVQRAFFMPKLNSQLPLR